MIERGLQGYDPRRGGTAAVLALHHLLERQHYRLAYWPLAGSEINYRRFFDINDLAGLRVENAATFEAVHRLVRRLIARGWLHGLRPTLSLYAQEGQERLAAIKLAAMIAGAVIALVGVFMWGGAWAAMAAFGFIVVYVAKP